MDVQPQQYRRTRRPQARLLERHRFGSDHGAHLLDRLSVVYKYRYVAISVFLLVVLASLLRTYTTTPLYRANARLMIEMEDERTAAMRGAIDTDTRSYWQDPKVYYETQYRMLTGSELVRRVVRRLDLGRVPEFTGRSGADGAEPAAVHADGPGDEAIRRGGATPGSVHRIR